jgi:hypothetical protein
MDGLVLPENIELRGFKIIDEVSYSAVVQEVTDFAKKIERSCNNFERLSLVLKPIHENEKSSKFEIQGKVLDNGRTFAAVNTDKNLLLAINKVFTKIENELKKQ